jgi:hypothetical protein
MANFKQAFCRLIEDESQLHEVRQMTVEEVNGIRRQLGVVPVVPGRAALLRVPTMSKELSDLLSQNGYHKQIPDLAAAGVETFDQFTQLTKPTLEKIGIPIAVIPGLHNFILLCRKDPQESARASQAKREREQERDWQRQRQREAARPEPVAQPRARQQVFEEAKSDIQGFLESIGERRFLATLTQSGINNVAQLRNVTEETLVEIGVQKIPAKTIFDAYWRIYG